MRKLAMAITYLPKISAVRSGECTQTIRAVRKGHKVSVGDEILFHGWSGRPYRSKWDWRKRVTVTEVISINIDSVMGVGAPYLPKSNLLNWMSWDSVYVTNLAVQDYIDPSTGEALRDVLFGLNGAPDDPEEYQIIRW